MKNLVISLGLSLIVFHLHAQAPMQQVMEKRAREMHRVICLADKEQWRKFIKENYAQTLIDKPMHSQVSNSDNEGTTSEKKEIGNNLEGKVNMFQRLHNDFGDSKIVSIKPDGDKLKMELSSSELSGTFNLKFSTVKPYLIEGLGIQIEGGKH